MSTAADAHFSVHENMLNFALNVTRTVVTTSFPTFQTINNKKLTDIYLIRKFRLSLMIEKL